MSIERAGSTVNREGSKIADPAIEDRMLRLDVALSKAERACCDPEGGPCNRACPYSLGGAS